MKKGVLVKSMPLLIGLFSLSSCASLNTQLDDPKLLIQIGISIAGIYLAESIKKDVNAKDTVIGKKINRRIK